jgi:hypothetical protein
VAVDIEDADRFAGLEAELGPLPPNPTIASARGDKRLFSAPADIDVARMHNVAGLGAKPGVDIKAKHGQVVAPGSVHATGVLYAWREESKIPVLPACKGDRFESRGRVR